MISTEKNTLLSAELSKKYVVSGIATNEDEIRRFLFSLGCYPGEDITVVSKLSDTFVVAIKDGRYSIDAELADAILI